MNNNKTNKLVWILVMGMLATTAIMFIILFLDISPDPNCPQRISTHLEQGKTLTDDDIGTKEMNEWLRDGMIINNDCWGTKPQND
jgi:hypothetical protein